MKYLRSPSYAITQKQNQSKTNWICISTLFCICARECGRTPFYFFWHRFATITISFKNHDLILCLSSLGFIPSERTLSTFLKHLQAYWFWFIIKCHVFRKSWEPQDIPEISRHPALEEELYIPDIPNNIFLEKHLVIWHKQ